jgi:hypothetical protein
MNEEAQQGQIPSVFRQKFSEFLFRKPGLKWKIWFALKVHPRSPIAQDICEQLFLEPLQAGDYKHFRKVAEALENMDRTAERPPGAKDQKNEMIHYAFWSAHYWLEHPPDGGWKTLKDLRKDVKELALNRWAAVKIWRSHMGHRDLLKLSLENKRQIRNELGKTPKGNGPQGTNWGRIWKDTGLMSLKDIYPDARQRSLTASTASRVNQKPQRSIMRPAASGVGQNTTGVS